MELDTWLKDCCKNYECIADFLDGMLIVSKDLQSMVDTLAKNNHFKLKGTGPTPYHLRCDFGRDEDFTLHFSPRKCFEKM